MRNKIVWLIGESQLTPAINSSKLGLFLEPRCFKPSLFAGLVLDSARWAWKRCLHTAGHDSETWAHATPEEFEPIPRLCRYILAVYEDDLRNPQWEPPRGYGIDPDCLIFKKNYEETHWLAPPYLVYLDHPHADIVLAIRGLNLAKESDYAVLLDNKLGKRKFDGVYVHNGLLKAAGCVLNAECDVLRELVEKYLSYTLTFTGHSLGSGVAALLTIVVVQNRDRLGNIDRRRVRCYAIAPARCMSLNLADDFLPRTATPLEDIFNLPCILCLRCVRDTFISEDKFLKDPRRLYAPGGRLYHIVERKPFRCGRFPLVVKTAVPVDGRFEHIVLSCNKDDTLEIPAKQRMERQESLAKEHVEEYRAALRRAVTLAVPHAFSPSKYGTFDETDVEDSQHSGGDCSIGSSAHSRRRENWDEIIERLFERDESGKAPNLANSQILKSQNDTQRLLSFHYLTLTLLTLPHTQTHTTPKSDAGQISCSMAPSTSETTAVKSSRSSNPSRKVRIIGKIRGFTDGESETHASDSNPWITVKKSKEDVPAGKSTVFLESQSASRKDGYELDHCYEKHDDIGHIYSREIQPMISDVFNGQNASVIAVGAKGSGKTHSIQGTQGKPGLAMMAMAEILSKAEELGKSVSVSLYEMTQEHAKDLLNPEHPTIQVPVKSMSEFQNIYLSQGNLLNAQKLPTDHPRNKGLMVHILSEDDKLTAKLANKINFVDLAGYEDPRKSSREGVTPTENNRKNKSLFALLSVVNAINSSESRVPYRESKLTRILQDSLGGTSRVLLLVCLKPCFCQDSLSFITLVSRTRRTIKQVLTDSTNRSQSSVKVKVLSSLESGKAMSTSCSVKRQVGNSRFLSAKKASGSVKRRKLFDEVKKVSHYKNQLKCQSEEISTQKSKMHPDLALAVTPFSLEEAPQNTSNSECCQTVEPNENVNTVEPEYQSKSKLQDTLLPNGPNDMLKTNSSPQGGATQAGTNLNSGTKTLEADITCEGGNSSHKKDDGSPPLSKRIKEISNNLKSLCASSTPLMVNTQENVIAPHNNQIVHFEINEPKTPVMGHGIARFCSPQGTFSNRSSGMKHSFVQEYLNFLNSANKEQLKSLKGIGDKRATYILDLREESPEPFKSLDDLEYIGLSAKQVCFKKVAGDLFS
ncbi:alpha/beta-Hydrolases superfamily protein [Striga asiatica]|uniref:Alpha/beta-Hydrolases superfamily protein n=1 Tax=Striga asiatica TaxID=4170 RepID=A0A5A7QZY3_STRAF|nr:alpha/beta-Hydrolases superfamily protein [Striga asiatica]